jgi:metallo-beta-lactamase family protein
MTGRENPKQFPNLRSLGGAGTVTGSRHLLTYRRGRLLVDCGLFQGLKHLRERNWAPFGVDPASIDAIILTHAHLDHSGYLPRLVREGFSGPVFCTSATADLCEILLRDSAHLAEKDADYANRQGFSKHRPAEPLYTVEDAERALRLLRPVRFAEDASLPGGVSFRFQRAGHILGAASVEITVDDRTILFSGDLGRYDDAFMFDPAPIGPADYVVVESTYGDRRHPKIDPLDALGDIVERTLARGGTIVIPAFAVGRAQRLLYDFWRLKNAGRLNSTPIFLDSPMAASATDLLCRHMEDHRFTRDVCKESCEVATYVSDWRESESLSLNPMPKIIISASGMATGGRVLRHIKAFGPDPRNTILFSGFQAAGTRGAKLLAGETETKIHGEWIPIRAEVDQLAMMSAHADADEIMRWLGTLSKAPRRAFIVHGEPAASEALRVRIGRDLRWDCDVVDPSRVYALG